MFLRILCYLCMTLISTSIIYPQANYDRFGKPFNLEISNNVAIPSFNDTTFILTDTLDFPIGYKPRPGQLSKDGLEYYVSLVKEGGFDSLYVLKRSEIGERFGQPHFLAGAVNHPQLYNDQPSITADKKTIVFVRSSQDDWAYNDLYIATRSDTLFPFDSVRFLAEINIPGVADAYPWISPDGLKLYFTQGNFPSPVLYFTSRNSTNDLFGPPQSINLTFSGNQSSAWLSDDELQLYFQSSSRIYYALRPTISDTFSIPIGFPEFSGLGFLSGPSLVDNELYLFNTHQGIDFRILFFLTDPSTVGIDETGENIDHNLKDFILFQNFPNPFNPSTTIRYSIKEEGIVTIGVYDMLGRMVQSLINKFQSAGEYTITFSGENYPSGIYLYKMSINNFSETKKLILIK